MNATNPDYSWLASIGSLVAADGLLARMGAELSVVEPFAEPAGSVPRQRSLFDDL